MAEGFPKEYRYTSTFGVFGEKCASLRNPAPVDAAADVAARPSAPASPSVSAQALTSLVSQVAVRDKVMVPSYVVLGCLLSAQQSQRARRVENDAHDFLAAGQEGGLHAAGQVGRPLRVQEREQGREVPAPGSRRARRDLDLAERHAGAGPGPGVAEGDDLHRPGALAGERRDEDQQTRVDLARGQLLPRRRRGADAAVVQHAAPGALPGELVGPERGEVRGRSPRGIHADVDL